MERLRAGLAGADVAIVEDAAQCQGATRHGRRRRLTTAIAATSFYPGKNLGAYGDAGAVVTDDAELATAVRTLGSHGGLTKYVHDVIGVNSRLDGAAGGGAARQAGPARRLEHGPPGRRGPVRRAAGVRRRRDPAGRPLPGNVHVWHLYVVRIPGDGSRPDATGCWPGSTRPASAPAIHYPDPGAPDAGLRRPRLRARAAFPHAERAAPEILSLPHLPADHR